MNDYTACPPIGMAITLGTNQEKKDLLEALETVGDLSERLGLWVSGEHFSYMIARIMGNLQRTLGREEESQCPNRLPETNRGINGSICAPAPPESAVDAIPVTRVKLWASGGCTGYNDYLMSDGSIQTIKVGAGYIPAGING